MENKLTKFEISKHLNVSRNRLNTLLKQLPPNKDEFDGRYYSDNYIDRLRKKFENQLNINMDEFKKKNNCYNSCELEKKLHINRTKIKQLVKDNNLLVIKFGNYEFYNETTIEQIIKLNKPRSVFRVKDGINGYIKYIDVIKELKISRSLLNKIIKTYKLNIINKCQVLFIKNEDFEFIKSLDIVRVYNSLISKHELCRICNISFNFLHYALKYKSLNLNPINFNSTEYYTRESIKLLQNYLLENPYIPIDSSKLTRSKMAKYLHVSLERITNYLQYFKPNSEEFDGKYYTYEFADKMKEFMNKHPSIRQNKVYVRELNNMEFDSKAEAYYYCYMKDHNHNIKHHPLNLYYLDSNGKKRRYEVDFMVDGKLVEIKGDIQFDENGKPFFRKKSWQEKYNCMIENNVEMILSSEFDENGIYKHMRYYFNKHYSFVKYIKELTEDINETDIKYMSHLRQSLAKNSEMFHCIETNESHFNFEWFEILHHRVNTKSKIYGHTYIKCSSSERNSYILSKIEELRSKGLDVSWFDKNKEKYLKTENEEETIFNL